MLLPQNLIVILCAHLHVSVPLKHIFALHANVFRHANFHKAPRSAFSTGSHYATLEQTVRTTPMKLTCEEAHRIRTSCYTNVIQNEDLAMAGLNVFELVEKGDLASLENLVRTTPEVISERDENGASLLHHASGGGHVTLIKLIMTAIDSEELNSCDEQGSVPLHWAVLRNQAESCRALLDLGANPNLLNMVLMSPLHLAISHGHNGLVDLLLSYSITDPDLQGDLENTPLMLACSVNNYEALSKLLKHGAKLCSQNKLGHFGIHAAAFAGATKAMEVILKAGEEYGYCPEALINYLDKTSSSPLHLAVRGGNIEAIRLCINTGAKIDQKQADKSTALHSACTQGAIEAVKLMLSSYNPVEDIINLPDGACQTPLHKSTLFDHVELAEYLLLMGADIDSIDCKGNSPLLLATSCGAWRTVILLLSKGANVNVKDRSGCNFLHLAILQPKGLKNLTEDILQHTSVKELLSCEDHEGCTPLHYACRLGIHDSVKNMLGLSGELCLALKSKDKKSALHFAAQYGRINTCHRLLETITDSRLVNEGDERGLTPLHLSSRGGHTKVVELLLRKGALFHSDYSGWTCLHHAASEGYTQTMEILLSTNVKLLDKTDEDGNTALHTAAKNGHVAAVRLMLSRGAELILNKNDATFLHEAMKHGKQDVVNAVIDSHRANEILPHFKRGTSQRCPVLDMIEFLPESFRYLLDHCVRESNDPNSLDYNIEYNFRWLQPPIINKKLSKVDDTFKEQPLIALNAMVQYNRIELLTHPVCQKYLQMKWSAYGSVAHILNMCCYLLGLLPLTHIIVTLKPTMNITSSGEPNVTMVNICFTEQSIFLTFCMAMVLVMNVVAIGKELVQISHQRWNYFKDVSNMTDWSVAILSLLFIIPLCLNLSGTLHWEAGAMAVFQSWVGFLLYLQRFEHFGIYVVMFGEIMKTLIRIILLFFFLVLAFGLTFYALMLNQKEFETVHMSVIQTFVMMVGELNYEDNFLRPYLNNQLPFNWLTYVIFIEFAMFMPILLVNLMIGLAVGDIAEVQRNATLKRIAMQIDLHTALEDKLPYWFMKRVDKPYIITYPNRKCSKTILGLLPWGDKHTDEVRPQLRTKLESITPIENELQKQKYRLKEMASLMEKQHNLLKLIICKMEITTEADEYDGPMQGKGSRTWHESQGNLRGSTASKWVPLMKAIEARRK